MTDLQDHPEYRGLVNAVRAAPDDDLPRLVLADWLDEHAAAEWAEFVRAQCELARHPHADRIRDDTFTDAEGVLRDWQDALTAARRERELWPAVARVIFTADTSEDQRAVRTRDGRYTFHDRWASYQVRRGFVERVQCALQHWVSAGFHVPLGPRLVPRQPVLRVEFDREWGGPELSWEARENIDWVSDHDLSQLPWCIATRLRGYTHRYRTRPEGMPASLVWAYATRAEADDALSDAAVAWAAFTAGL